MAAATCAYLLRNAGFDPLIEPGARPKLPAIMVGQATQSLMTDVLHRPDLFSGLTEIRRRVVRWGQNAEAVTLPHSAVIVPEQLLLDRLQIGGSNVERSTSWTIYAAPPLPDGSQNHQFGSRLASASRVNIKPETATDACWVESVANGWLFLLPDGTQHGWMLSVGGEPNTLLGESRLLVDQIESITQTGGCFPAHPRVVDPLCAARDGWLACGSAAMGFDPLCGDGAGNATREAILASAAVKAILREDADPRAIMDHYQSRLLAGFHRHLEVCHEFYRRGGQGPWWDGEREAIRQGLAWVAKRLHDQPPFRFRLNGFTLEPIQ